MLLSAALCATVSFGAIRAVTPTAWDGKPDCWQMKRHFEKMASVTNGGAKVVFIGDSITHYWESKGSAQLAKYFGEGDMKMLDLGTSADRTEHVLWRLTEGKELDGYEAKVVFLMIGTNNSGHFPIEKEPPSDTILGIREILNVIRAKQPKAKVVLTAIFPRGADANDACRKRNDVVNKEIVKFADGKDIFWLDLSDEFLTADGRLSREIFPDLLHPNAYGYELWAAAALPYARAAVAGLPMPPNRYARPRAGFFRMNERPSTFPSTRIRSEGYGKYDWWLDRLLLHRNQIEEAKGEFDIVMLGDSITHNYDDSRPHNPGFGPYAELKETYKVLGLGYSGDSTQEVLWRGAYGEFDGYKAKCVMLMIGTNNRGSAEDVVAGIRAVLDLLARKQPEAKVLLLPIFPRGESAKDGNRLRNEAVNKEIVKFADGKKVIWVDFNAKLVDEKGDTKKWMADRLHPGPEAYKTIWQPAVLPHFREIIGK